MRRIVGFVLLGLVATGWLVVELAAPPYAEARLEEAVRDRTQGVAVVSSDLASFPVVTRLVATGRIPRLTVDLEQVTRGQVNFARVRLDVRGIVLDRTAMFGGDVVVRDIDRGVVTVGLRAADLATAVGLPVEVVSGGLQVLGATGPVRLGPSVSGGELVLTAAGLLDLALPLPLDLLPCVPEVAVEDDLVVLTCTFDDVPAVLAGAAQS